jgi:glucose dehydrogenase
MRGKIAAVVACAATSLVAVSVVAQTQNTADSAPGFVNDQRLRAAAMPDGNWITFGRDYSNQRFAPLDQIDRSNVARLSPVWVYQFGMVGSTQTHPIVVDGVMYVTFPGNDVAALDAATGREIWR